jgi:hypothetical protein
MRGTVNRCSRKAEHDGKEIEAAQKLPPYQTAMLRELPVLATR